MIQNTILRFSIIVIADQRVDQKFKVQEVKTNRNQKVENK